MDVMSVYLNGVLEEEIYMKQPPGYATEPNSKKVRRLRKSLYGLKQSARCWNATLDAVNILAHLSNDCARMRRSI